MKTLAEFETYLRENGVLFASVWIPREDGDLWRVNLRDGPGWVCGPPAGTLTEALDLAMKDFRREWADKRDKWRKVKAPEAAKPAPVDDPLGDLLG